MNFDPSKYRSSSFCACMQDAIWKGWLLLSGSPLGIVQCMLQWRHEQVKSENAADSNNIIVRDPQRLVHHLVSSCMPNIQHDCPTQSKNLEKYSSRPNFTHLLFVTAFNLDWLLQSELNYNEPHGTWNKGAAANFVGKACNEGVVTQGGKYRTGMHLLPSFLLQGISSC